MEIISYRKKKISRIATGLIIIKKSNFRRQRHHQVTRVREGKRLKRERVSKTLRRTGRMQRTEEGVKKEEKEREEKEKMKLKVRRDKKCKKKE